MTVCLPLVGVETVVAGNPEQSELTVLTLRMEVQMTLIEGRAMSAPTSVETPRKGRRAATCFFPLPHESFDSELDSSTAA
jgi:hypothetical protein